MPGRRTPLLAAALVALVGADLAPAARAETPIPPPPQEFVTDRAGFVSPAAARDLSARLAAYERATGHQIIVYVDRSTGGVPIEDWAVRAFERWRVGRRGIDDGAALFVFSDDRRVRIEVGYGLEGQLPDVVAGRIIDQQIVPRIRAGDRDGAVRAGVEGIIARIGGGGAAGAPVEQPVPHIPRWALVVGGLALLGLLLFALTHPSLAVWLLYSIASGRGGGGFGGGGRGGFSGGGGGFSGGGGSSGGGGASGSW